MRILAHILLILTFMYPQISLGQSVITEFGKNRIQYHNDYYNWSQYETENFVTYWYGKGREIAQPVIQLAELDHEEIQKTLEHALSRKIEIIVYTDLTDLLQTNIGSEQAFTNESKTTKVDGNKILVYFDGNHKTLRTQIKKGIANVYMNSILFGTKLKEIVQNMLQQNTPAWFVEGLINYSASGWDRYIEDELRDLWADPDMRDFEKLVEKHPRVAGHSLFYIIAENYGQSDIANIVYLKRIGRTSENSILYTLGVEFRQLKKIWTSHFQMLFKGEKGLFEDTDNLTELELKNKKGVPISTIKISPDGNKIAYVTHDRGKTKVYVRNVQDGEEQLVFKKGYKNIFQEPDYNYPLIAWHPSFGEISILYEHRDISYLKTINLKSGEEETTEFTTNFQRVYSLSYIAKDRYVVSATTDGYSDLYLYDSDRRYHERLTHDFYDDLEAECIDFRGEKAILFRSNRKDLVLEKQKIDTILPVDNFDLFVMRDFENDPQLIRLTQTNNINERSAYLSGINQITFIQGASGVDNLYSLDLDTKKIKPVTNNEHNAILHHVNPKSGLSVMNYYHDGSYKTFVFNSNTTNIDQVNKTVLSRLTRKNQEDVFIPYLPETDEKQDYSEGMKFQSLFDDPESMKPIDQGEQEIISDNLFNKYFKNYFSDSYLDGKRIVRFEPMRASASRTKFRLENFSSKLDNSVLFEGLESYTGEDKELGRTPAGILLKGEIIDLLEDYHINIGLRVPTRLNGYEYFVTLDNNQKLWDKRLALYRKSEAVISDQGLLSEGRQKRHAFLAMYRLSYPFDVYQSVRITSSLRFDKYLQQSIDENSYLSSPAFEKRLSLKGEYVFDNSYVSTINILNGSRVKIFSEIINEFDVDNIDKVRVNLSTAITGILGFDARHYVPLFSKAILALRGTGATSFGSKGIVYYLGGMESDFLARSEVSTPLPGSDNSAYKVNAPHLRGFGHNIRNGNKYLLSNMELRLPIAHILGIERIKFAFIRNLQLTSFFDAGLAWYGLNPNSEENTLNSVSVANPPGDPVIAINARFFQDPVVYGYGFGARTTLLGYFLKVDYGWGVETGLKRPPRLHISMGMDF